VRTRPGYRSTANTIRPVRSAHEQTTTNRAISSSRSGTATSRGGGPIRTRLLFAHVRVVRAIQREIMCRRGLGPAHGSRRAARPASYLAGAGAGGVTTGYTKPLYQDPDRAAALPAWPADKRRARAPCVARGRDGDPHGSTRQVMCRDLQTHGRIILVQGVARGRELDEELSWPPPPPRTPCARGRVPTCRPSVPRTVSRWAPAAGGARTTPAGRRGIAAAGAAESRPEINSLAS
jgi:hypothetical protein